MAGSGSKATSRGTLAGYSGSGPARWWRSSTAGDLPLRAEVTAQGKDWVDLRVVGDPLPDRVAPCRVTLATAVPKGDRFDWLVEKATELGVDRVVPIVTERSVVDPRATKLDRLRRLIVEASKQCGRNRLMVLEQPCPGRPGWPSPRPPRSGWLLIPAACRRSAWPQVRRAVRPRWPSAPREASPTGGRGRPSGGLADRQPRGDPPSGRDGRTRGLRRDPGTQRAPGTEPARGRRERFRSTGRPTCPDRSTRRSRRGPSARTHASPSSGRSGSPETLSIAPSSRQC